MSSLLRPVEQRLVVTALPAIKGLQRSLTPIKFLVRAVIGWPVNEDNKVFVFGANKPSVYAAFDERTDGLPEGLNVQKDDG